MTTPTLRRATAACAAAAVALTATTASAAAFGSQSTSGRDGVDFKTRAVNAMLQDAETDTRSAGASPAPAASARRAAAGQPAEDKLEGKALEGPQSLSDATAAECDTLGLDWTPTHDRIWLHWNDIGRDNYTIARQREGGTWQTLGSTTTTSFVDSRSNPHGFTTYRLVGDNLSCDLGSWVTMTTPDGLGEVDAIYGGASATGTGEGQLMEQDAYSYAMPADFNGVDPAFSPDGHFVAFSRLAAGQEWNLSVATLHSSQRKIVTSLTMPANRVGAEAAWSPDGRRVAYTSYAIDDQGNATAPELHVFDVAAGTDRLVSGSEGLVHPDWRSATTLVAAGAATGEGLYTIPAAGGTKAAIANTDHAGYPEVAPDGRVWFVTGDGTTFAVKVLTPGSPVPGTARESTTHWYERPRVAPDGTVYVIDIDGHDPTNPDDNTFTVTRGTFGPDGQPETAIGATRDPSLAGFHGFDIRHPRTKGTSDFAGDANNDIIARDSAGTLWVYPMNPDSLLSPRVRVGAGWQIYTQVLAAGDLNGDSRGDILAVDRSGVMWFYAGAGGAKFPTRVRVSGGWGTYVAVSTGDLSGDGRADVIARDSAGTLWLYRGNGAGGLGSRSSLGGGWNAMNAMIGVGDWNYDNRSDVLARERSTGILWLYPGSGTGSLSARRSLGKGWNAMSGFGSPENLLGMTGLLARRTTGELLYYRSVGDGVIDNNQVYLLSGGWQSYSFTS